MVSPIHHFHIRKRIHKKHEKYPHPDRAKRTMDKIVYLVGVLGPIMTLPQLYRIWLEKTVAGVSVISWGFYLFMAFVWTIYGFMHKEKPIIIMNILWMVMDVFIVLGVLLYG